MPSLDAIRRDNNCMADYDFAIVGGGLVGSSIAWGLARAGYKLVVLDEGDVAYRASRGNFALISVQRKGLGLSAYGLWTKRSSDAWPVFHRELHDISGVDVAFERAGGLQLCLSDAELDREIETVKQLYGQRNMFSYPYEILDHAGVSARIPEIGPEVVGGIYFPVDGQCNSLRLFHALHSGMRPLGIDYRPNRRVEQISGCGGGFRITTANGEVIAEKLVLAAGLSNARLGPMVGLNVPVRPQRGQIIVTEKIRPFLHYPLYSMRQTDEGSVMLGDSVEEVGLDDRVSYAVLSTMASRAVRTIPLLGTVNVVRTWAALRIMTEDGFPIYDESDRCRGAYVATCHSGVTLAAAHALVLPSMLVGSHLPDELAPFSARRFAGHGGSDVQKAD